MTSKIGRTRVTGTTVMTSLTRTTRVGGKTRMTKMTGYLGYWADCKKD